MTSLYIAGNYVNYTDALVGGIDDGIGYGHLQLVYGANEIEVQAGSFVTAGPWVFPDISPIPRNHLDNTNYSDGTHPDHYEIIAVDVSASGSDRTAEDVWTILKQAHEQFAAQASISYDLDQNSNSYITTLLGMVGLSSSGYAAQLANSIQNIYSFRGVQHSDILQEYSIDFSLVGGDHDDIIFTGIGVDTLIGGAGNDQFWSGDGNDTLVGDRGNDQLDGGEGVDTADYSGTLANTDSSGSNGISVNFTIGADSIPVIVVVDNWGNIDNLFGVEIIIGTDKADSFSLSGNASTVFADAVHFDGRGSGDGDGDTVNFSGVTGSNGIFVDLSLAGGFASLTAGFNVGDTIGIPDFENVIGTGSNDTITGNSGNNILYGGGGADSLSGGAGDDILIFDADDTLVEGGAGRDVGIVSGEAGVTVDLAATGLEVVVGGAGADNFTLNGQGDTLQMVAGGGGVDTFTINVDDTSETVVVWGGEGADRFQINNSSGPLGIMTVNIDGLIDENFADFDLDMLGLGSGFNWGAIDVVVVNSDSSDRFYTGNNITDDTTDDGSLISVREGTIGISVTNTNTGGTFVAYSQTMSLLAGSYGNYAVGIFDAGFLNTETMSIQTSVEVLTSVYFQPIDPDTNEPYSRSGSVYREDDPDTPEYEGDPFPEWSDLMLGTADYTTRFDFGETTDVDAIGDETNAFFWINYYSPNAPEWNNMAGPNPYGYAEGVDTLSGVGTLPSPVGPWFVVGGGFENLNLSANGSISVTMPENEIGFSVTDWLASVSGDIGGGGGGGGSNPPPNNPNFNTGLGTKTVSTFSTGTSTLTFNGTATDPNDTTAGYSMAQVGANVEVDFGGGDVVTLENVTLTEWQTAAATQFFGSAAGETLTGTSQDEVFSAGAGDDLIIAGSGDDTINYVSGDDVIKGHKSNYGNDTLDLSQYTADQVIFRIVGHDVFIDTPDGTIELDYQVRYELGHARSNIENIVFSDGTLDDAAIRDRAIADQTSAGDDVVTGSYQTDTISTGAGNDIIYAGSGDDVIIYTSGDDVIIGNNTGYNYGNDTLDLSKYTADQVSFRIVGHDVFIDTPDGSIELDYQVRNELGDARLNIENIIFSDGSLDEAGIAARAISDQASSGDDVITGSFQSEVITGGAGNDTLSGVSGSDTFVFAVGDGVDVITDYDAANDALEFTGINFSDLTITQTGSDVLIEYGAGDQLTVTGSLVADFVVDEFVFA